MEEKTLDEQFDEILNHPLGGRIVEIHHYAKPIYRNEVWPSHVDGMKRIIIRHLKAIVEKVNLPT